MALSAGKLRHRITIERKVQTRDATTGEFTNTWAPVCCGVPAAIEPLSARELIAAQTTGSEVVARITIRYRSGLDASMRIRRGTVIYNIAGILPDKESGLDYLTIPVSAGVNEG